MGSSCSSTTKAHDSAHSSSARSSSAVRKVATKAEFDKILKEAGNKLVTVDFTATWCPPCRHISPVFDKMASENLDVLFLKVDVDENAETSEACKINCMPTFQFYRKENKIDQFEGADQAKLKAKVKTLNIKPVPTPTLAPPGFSIASLGDKFITAEGKTVGKEALENKVLGIYFSAHWCPPCRGFTPQLVETYKALQKAANGKQFEIVFVSSDRDDQAFKNYHNTMPWLALPFSDRQRKAELCKMFNISGIPSLIMLDTDGSMITDKARGRVGGDPAGKEFPWR